MIHTWSDLLAAVKKWFDTPLKWERKTYSTTTSISQEDLNSFKKINDLMKAPRNASFNDVWRRDYDRNNWYDDPYYKNLKIDDSMWQDQINQEVDAAEGRLQTEPDPAKRAARRQELLRKIRMKYGLDHP